MTQPDATRPSLLVRIRDPGDRRAWEQFVEIYAPLVYQTARRRGLQDCDAADLTQEVLRSVASSVGRLEYDPRKGTFRGWLYTVTRNALNSFLEARRRSPRATGDPDVQALLESQPSREDPSEEWDREYQLRILAYAAEQVRPSFEDATWQAFWRTAVDGRPSKEVASELGMSMGALYIARSRVLGRIRDHVRLLLEE
ncbi:ECF RNA polymerase sigma factor SigE [Aquisphaera giovannonii]|uniref:ECF RNA polymerase sigma factor SigE n=1 Tax=Aquisphaera giovannonii TaxID=406548 RepID=A0A5B9W2H2_9BACT|nr:sigma-70 family RNA polymerase sigma factor [Aquisphaera giovannonii]QEH34479.1 ECF RNA polymerase sigma factor SigE [Aquisphaera giovannonii]